MRIYIVFFAMVLFTAVLSGRLFALQVKDHGFFKAFARGQQQVFEEIVPERGTIFARERNGNLVPLAVMRDWQRLYAVPKDIEDSETLSQRIAEILGVPQETLFEKLSKRDDPYEPIASQLDDMQAEAVRALSARGLVLVPERLRFYPQGTMAAHLLGFLAFSDEGNERKGTYGIEASFDAVLRGITGTVHGERDARGRVIAAFSRIVQPSSPGADVVLTTDPNIQHRAETILEETVARWGATGGSIIVMEPQGAVRALANAPSFDPNHFREEKNPAVFANAAVSDLFEPGSVFKPITLAAALEGGAIGPHTLYENTGSRTFGSYTITNTLQQYNGMRTMTEVLAYSLNTGAVFAMEELGYEKFRSFLKAVRLDQKTGIELPQETAGNMKNLDSGRDINFATASFGQGIAATPLGFLRAISFLANGGFLSAPYLVEEIRHKDGTVEQRAQEPGEAIASPRTVRLLTAMMVQVVNEGTGKTAKIDGWNIAGKTGTAQVPHKDRSGYSEETIHSFVGYFPAFAPRYVVLVELDSPHVRYAESSAAPAFRELAEFLIAYAGIPPDQP